MPTSDLQACVTGGLRFGVLDKTRPSNDGARPLVCAVGINYTQQNVPWQGGLYEFGTTVASSGTYKNTALLIAAAHRNREAWVGAENVDLDRPCLGEIDGADRPSVSGPRATDVEPFMLIMTNLVPFITKKKWQDQVRATRSACETLLHEYGSSAYLDDLTTELGAAIDLWIGHSSIHGTQWVWPSFDAFRRRHALKSWLFGPNLNPQAHLYLDREFRKPGHRLLRYFM